MSSPTQKRVAIVTGASSGIGRETAIALSAAGWSVVLSARREADLEHTAKLCPHETVIVRGDITTESYVKDLFKKTLDAFGRLDMLFNNAGIVQLSTPIDEISLESFQEVFDVNVIGLFLCTREAFRIFKAQSPPGGRIINNGSISAYTPRLHAATYTATKHAVLGLTKSTALDGRAHNITCTQIDIGNAATPMVAAHPTTLQADGSVKREANFDVKHVANAVVHIANLPTDVTVLQMNIMATGMPFVGRG